MTVKKILILVILMLPILLEKVKCQPEEKSVRTTSHEPDIYRKSLEIKQLTNNAVKYFLNHSVETVCNDFVHKSVWRKGEMFPFVFREDGTVLAHGDNTDLIWKNISAVKGVGGTSLIREMMTQRGGRGYLSFNWQHGYQYAYIQIVRKNGVRYIIGSGFYPESEAFLVKQIVSSAASYFYRKGKEATFSLIDNQRGPFVRGHIYVFVYDFNGVVVAHGENSALIGQNVMDMKDVRGKLITKEIINAAKAKGRGWINYYWEGEYKRSYVERVIDPKTKKPYAIGAGYFPYITLNTIEGNVDKAVRYLQSHGPKDAFAEFNNQVGQFSKGGQRIFAYDFDGKCLADGRNPGFVGQNLIKQRDQEGKLIVKEIINVAKKYGKGLIQSREKNAPAIYYIQAVDVPDGKFIVGSHFHPFSKTQSTRSLVTRAIEAIKTMKPAHAFSAFTDREGRYHRGDLSIFVYDTNGVRLVNGSETSQIWRNFIKSTDQDGKQVVGDIISTAVNGGGWVEYHIRNAVRRVYSKVIELESKSGEPSTYIVGSGYYL